MRSLPILSALLGSLILLSPGAPVAAQGLVGDWGDPQRIVITGSRHWTAEEIRRELVSTLDVIVAAHPASTLEDYPQLLADRVRDGYLKGGFALADVSVQLDPKTQQILVTISEGPRYFTGDISVNGPPGLDAEHVAAWLTAIQPERGARMTGFKQQGADLVPQWVDKQGKRLVPERPVWAPGKPVCFPTGRSLEYTTAVQRALEQQGCPRAMIDATIVRDDQQHMANLQVVIRDLGRRNTIDRIDVTGSKRDAPADVLRYLGVRQGQLATESHCAAWRHKLWLSGRYLEQEVSVDPALLAGDEVGLKIHLVDYPPAPPLREPLTPEEQLVLKCREWVMNAIDRGDALVVRGKTETMQLEFISQPDQGTLCLLEPLQPATGAKKRSKTALPAATLVAAVPGELLHINGGGTQLLRAFFNQGQFVVNIDLQPNPNLKDTKHDFALKMGVGFRSSNGMHAQEPVAVSLSIAPAALLSMIRNPETKHSIEEGVLTVRSRGTTCKIEVATGRLLDCNIQTKKGGPQFQISIESGSFGEYLAAAERRVGADAMQRPNAYSAHRPVSSAIEFLLNSPLTEMGLDFFDNQQKRSGDLVAGARALNRLVAGDAFWPVDAGARKIHGATENDFRIPVRDKSPFEPSADFPHSNGATAAMGMLTLKYADDAFPRESWPWTVSRDSALFLMKQPQFVHADLEKLQNSQAMGPVGHLITAMLLEQMNNDSAATFAASGLDLLSLQHFRADYRPFLDPNKHAGQILLRSAELLSEFTDDDADDLGYMLLGKDHKLMVVVVRYLREHKAEPITQALPGMLDHLWDHGLSKAVKSRLQSVQSHNERLVKAKQKSAEQARRVTGKTRG